MADMYGLHESPCHEFVSAGFYNSYGIEKKGKGKAYTQLRDTESPLDLPQTSQ
jgi:hypothetical protein